MSDPIKRFAVRVAAIFPVADDVDQPALFAALAENMMQFDDAALARGAGFLLRTHKRRTFPSIAECIQACIDANPDAKSKPQANEPDKWQDGQDAAARILRGQALAQEAYDGGWFGGLWDFCAAQNRLPLEREIHRISRDSVINRREMMDSIRAKDQFAHLARKMVARYDDRALSVGVVVKEEDAA